MLNRVVLIGRLTKDPELRYSPSGVAVTKFTLAVDRKFKNAQGEKETDFIPIVAFKQLAELAAEYLAKGKLASVDGRMQTRNYDKDGQKVYVTEVIAEDIHFLSPKGDTASTQQSQSHPSTQQPHPNMPNPNIPPGTSMPSGAGMPPGYSQTPGSMPPPPGYSSGSKPHPLGREVNLDDDIPF